MRIDQQQKGVVTDCLTFKTEDIASIAAQQHPNTTNEWRHPFVLAHLASAGIEPHHVANLQPAYSPTLEKFRTAKNWMRITKSNQLSCELQKPILLFVARPIEPADLIVLAISIVIAVL